MICVHPVNNVPLLVEILSPFGANGYLSLAAAVSLQELERVTARYDSGTLVVQQGRRVPFQYGYVMAQRLQCNAGCQPS
jgi:hypothetical protein